MCTKPTGAPSDSNIVEVFLRKTNHRRCLSKKDEAKSTNHHQTARLSTKALPPVRLSEKDFDNPAATPKSKSFSERRTRPRREAARPPNPTQPNPKPPKPQRIPSRRRCPAHTALPLTAVTSESNHSTFPGVVIRPETSTIRCSVPGAKPTPRSKLVGFPPASGHRHRPPWH